MRVSVQLYQQELENEDYKNVTICNSENTYEALRNGSNEMCKTQGKDSKTLRAIEEQ